MPNRRHWPAIITALALVGSVLWLRWPGFGFNVWNVDEAIHAAAAREILGGGVMYRDAIDQRTPLSYYAVAAVFAIAGENNLWAVRCFIAGLIAATAWLLFLVGRRLSGTGAGLWSAGLYASLSSCLLYQGDANAANTEWFLALFSSAAAAVLLGGTAVPENRRTYASGLLLGLAFLSKQPALLDVAAPGAFFLWLAWQRRIRTAVLWPRLASLAVGWLTPVALTGAYFAWHGALGDFVFCSWSYNLAYYGPEITADGRIGALLLPFKLLAGPLTALLIIWLLGAATVIHRLLQRQPAPGEETRNPALAFLAAWHLSALAGSASSGRDFHHYVIQFLPAFCVGLGLAMAHTGRLLGGGRRWFIRGAAGLLLAAVLWQLGVATLAARARSLPADPSVRVSAYIREHSAATDRIFVWGFHPDIYLHSDRRAGSRYLYSSFVTGLVPWTNTAPDKDTRYAIVPGAIDVLLRDLAASRPAFIVDCSAGPNRHWQKYPLGKFPPLHDYVQQHYKVVEAGQFVPQGFRLYQRRRDDEPVEATPAMPELPTAVASTLSLGVLGPPLPPVHASAPHGASFSMVDGRAEYFAHAPSSLVYRIAEGPGALRGGFGLRPGAYAAENRAPSDGAEFIIRWRQPGGKEQVLLRRLLQPGREAGDRGVQSFRVDLPPERPGELLLVIEPGPTGNPASDWTFWTDLILETFR
jgi:4-amino-4-deoxy-L-arabinose transferase-like glycosyltransferase